MKKKMTALFLSLALTMSLSVPAFAAEVGGSVVQNPDGSQTIGGINSGTGGFGQGSDVAWSADVVAGDIISVVMPTSVDFYIKLKDAGYTADASKTQMGFDTVLSGEAKITNNSSCAVKLDCVGVTDGGITSSAAAPAGQLPGQVLNLVELALGKVDNSQTLSDAQFMAGTLNRTGIAAAPIELGSIPKPSAAAANANVMSLWMHGRKLPAEAGATWFEVMKSVAADETVTATVTTTLKVSVAAAPTT